MQKNTKTQELFNYYMKCIKKLLKIISEREYQKQERLRWIAINDFNICRQQDI